MWGMVRDDDEMDPEDVMRTASMLQARQLITNNAIAKRKEQLTRWLTSEMNSASVIRRNSTIQFQDADIFLSACMSGDEDEVDELLDKGADINTSTVDGLTALHQAVIDSKPDMVRFLCEKGADVNAQDNEGWTPLHAAACCGNLSIIQYLIAQDADLSIINSDKEVALDLAEDEACRNCLEQEYNKQGISVEQCREQELRMMMDDAKEWVRSGHFGDVVHPRTGATALHVAAAKGYTQLVELLIQAGADVNAQDHEGWTPLHAGSHWAEKDSCKILIEHGAKLDILTTAGQNVLAVAADKEIVGYLEELDKSTSLARVSPPEPVSVLAEKNQRIIPAAASPVVAAAHHPHLLSSEQKHALAIMDERNENEALHTIAKHPRLSEKSPSPPEENGTASIMQTNGTGVTDGLESQDEESTTDRASSEKSREASVQPTTAEVRQQRESSSASASASASISTPSSEKEISPEREAAPCTPSTSVQAAASPPQRSPASSIERSHSDRLPSTNKDLSDTASDRSSSGSAEKSVSATVSLRSQPALWINQRVPLNSSRGVSSVTRSASTPTTLPWVRAAQQQQAPPQPMQASNFPSFLARDRVSAFKPPSKTARSLEPTSVTSQPATAIRPSFRPQPLAAPVMRPWQGSATTTNESEAERRNTARMQRQYRRSTQGVTKEQLEEASRVAAEESAKRRIEKAENRLSSVDREEKKEVEASSRPVTGVVTGVQSSSAQQQRPSPLGTTTATATLSLPASATTVASPQSTPSAANLRRKNQVISVAGRTGRRGTGPVLAEDVHAAVTLRCVAPTVAVTGAGANTPSSFPTAGYTPSAGKQFQSGAASGFPTLRTAPQQQGAEKHHEKSRSAPPMQVSSLRPTPPIPASPRLTNTTRPLTTAPVAQISGTSSATTQSASATTSSEKSSTESSVSAPVNYRMLYEQQCVENEKLRREMSELRKSAEQSAALRRTASATTTVSPSRSTTTSLTKSPSSAESKSYSGSVSMDDHERKQYGKRIAELEYEIKEARQLEQENARLRGENEALVRVLAKLARPPAAPTSHSSRPASSLTSGERERPNSGMDLSPLLNRAPLGNLGDQQTSPFIDRPSFLGDQSPYSLLRERLGGEREAPWGAEGLVQRSPQSQAFAHHSLSSGSTPLSQRKSDSYGWKTSD